MDDIKKAFLESVRFPPYTPLPDWVEQNIVLSARACPTPGLMQLWKQQRGILEAIDNPKITRISVMKAARLGYTKSIMGVIGHYASNHPCSVLLLLPTEDDCNRMSRDEVAPIFQESPTLQHLLSSRQGPGDRDSLTAKYYVNGSSLKIVAARAPRNLRSHDVKILLLDEIDVYEQTSEGDAIKLAVRRTLAHPDRKIIAGSSPSLDGESPIQRLWELSDKRIFETPCPHCEVPFEIQMEHLTWPPERPEEAFVVCPSCGCVIEEAYKPQMIALGEWRITEPSVKNHAGFRMNCFISLFENASCANIAAEYLNAQLGGPSTMRVFENVVLGKCSSLALDSIDASGLASRTENFSLENLPAEVLLITAGCDVQGDRIEAVFVGHALNGEQYILAHTVLMGNTAEAPVWASLDRLLASEWRHPRGYKLKAEATAIDSSYRSQHVYNFTQPRHYRGIFGVKGQLSKAGIRNPIWAPGFTKSSRAVKLYFVSVDQVKILVIERFAALPFLSGNSAPCADNTGIRNPSAYRFSDNLPETFFEQCANERRYLRFVHNKPVHEFHPVQQGARTEAIDCLVYATACRYSLAHINMKERSMRGLAPSPLAPRKDTMADRYKRLSDLNAAIGSFNSGR